MRIEYVEVAEAIGRIRSGDHIHWPCVAGAPEALIRGLVMRAERTLTNQLEREEEALHDITISHLYTEGYAGYVDERYRSIFQLDSFFVGANVRGATQEGRADYIPCSLSETSRMIREGAIGSDVVFLMVSEPDEEGYVSLGTSVDYMPAAIDKAREVIAQVNRHVPYCYGDARIPITKITTFVRHDQELNEAGPLPLTEKDIAIGKYCASIIPDGATLQMGIGNIPTAVLSQLGGHKDLGIHSEMFTDDVIPLIDKGVINGRCKKIDVGKHVAMFLKGSKRLYDYVDKNKDVYINDVAYTNHPFIIAQNPRVVAINSAIAIDLSGQVCADSMGNKIYSGSGGQLDFMIGATYSEGGVPIIAMPSITGKGVSKIVPTLATGSGVVTPRTLTRWVVTEYGAVNLYGLSLKERAKALMLIAHPTAREELNEYIERHFK